MKKFFASLIVFVLIFAITALVGCEKTDKTSSSVSVEKFTVKFIYDGKESKDVVEKGQTATPPYYSSTSTLTGTTTIEGWYLDQEFTQKFDIENTSITQDVILYGKLKQENPYLTVKELLAKIEQNSVNAKTYDKVTSIKGRVNNGETFEVPEQGFDIADGKITINGKQIRVSYDKAYFNEFFSDTQKTFSKQTIVYNTSGNYITMDIEYTKNSCVLREQYVLNSDNYVTTLVIVDKTDSENYVRDYNLGSIVYGTSGTTE